MQTDLLHHCTACLVMAGISLNLKSGMLAGEYVAVEMLEAVYGKCPLVQQLWVYGNR